MDDQYLKRLVEEFRNSKEAINTMTKRQDSMKKELIQAIQDNGYMDEKGNFWLEVGDTEIKYERRASVSLDIAAAIAWCKENGHWDDVKEVIETLSEDKLLGLAWINPDLQDTVQSFYTTKETWAFKA